MRKCSGCTSYSVLFCSQCQACRLPRDGGGSWGDGDRTGTKQTACDRVAQCATVSRPSLGEKGPGWRGRSGRYAKSWRPQLRLGSKAHCEGVLGLSFGSRASACLSWGCVGSPRKGKGLAGVDSRGKVLSHGCPGTHSAKRTGLLVATSLPQRRQDRPTCPYVVRNSMERAKPRPPSSVAPYKYGIALSYFGDECLDAVFRSQ